MRGGGEVRAVGSEDLPPFGYQVAEVTHDVLLQRRVDEGGDKSHPKKGLSLAEIL